MLEVPADGDYDREKAERAELVGLHLAGSQPPLVRIRTWHGEVAHERALARWFGPEQPIISVAPPRGKAVEDFPEDAHAWADFALARLKTLADASPLRLGGWSFGGMVAYEVAERLARAGGAVDLVALIDTRVPVPHRERRRVRKRRGGIHKAVRSLDSLLEEPTWRKRLAYVGSRTQRRRKKLVARAKRIRAWWRGDKPPVPGIHPDVDPGDAIFVTGSGQRISLLQRAIWVAYRKYQPTPSALPVLLLRTADSQLESGDVSLGWAPFLQGRFETAVVPGNHYTMFEDPHVPVLAQRIASALEAASASLAREPEQLAS